MSIDNSQFNLIQLTKEHTKDLMKLFVHCFSDNHYYVDILTGCLNKNVAEMFYNPIMYCIDSGESYGVFKNKTLVAYTLVFDLIIMEQKIII